MPHTKVGMYLFSMARGDLGRIVASRPTERCDCVGSSFFSIFGIDSSQVERMRAVIQEDTNAFAFALEGKKKSPHIYLVFSNFCYETGLFIAIDPCVPAKAMKYLLRRGALGNVNICFEDNEITEESESEDEISARVECYRQVCDIFAYMNPLFGFGNKSNQRIAEDTEINSDNLAELIGLSVNHSIKREPGPDMSKLVFAGGFCAIAFILTAIMAHKCSVNNTLSVEAEYHGKVMAFRLSFVTGRCRDWESVLESLSVIAGGCHDIYFSYRETEMPKNSDGSTLLTIEFFPFYEDSGLLGVKRRDLFFDDPYLMDFKDFFILNRITNDKTNNNEQ